MRKRAARVPSLFLTGARLSGSGYQAGPAELAGALEWGLALARRQWKAYIIILLNQYCTVQLSGTGAGTGPRPLAGGEARGVGPAAMRW